MFPSLRDKKEDGDNTFDVGGDGRGKDPLSLPKLMYGICCWPKIGENQAMKVLDTKASLSWPRRFGRESPAFVGEGSVPDPKDDRTQG